MSNKITNPACQLTNFDLLYASATYSTNSVKDVTNPFYVIFTLRQRRGEISLHRHFEILTGENNSLF